MKRCAERSNLLNNAEYDWICRYIPEKKKKTAEYARILNVSDAVHMRRSLYKLLSSYLDGYSEHC